MPGIEYDYKTIEGIVDESEFVNYLLYVLKPTGDSTHYLQFNVNTHVMLLWISQNQIYGMLNDSLSKH